MRHDLDCAGGMNTSASGKSIYLARCFWLNTQCILYAKYKESCKHCVYSCFISLDLSQGVLCVLRLTSLCIVNTDEFCSLGSHAEENEAGPRIHYCFSSEYYPDHLPAGASTQIYTHTHEEMLIKTLSACAAIYMHTCVQTYLLPIGW